MLPAEVTFVDLQPRDTYNKVFRTVFRERYEERVHARHWRALSLLKGKSFDKVIFLQVHQMDISQLDSLRSAQRSAEFILYNWDALTTHDYLPYVRFFDRVVTFDKSDAVSHGFEYLPLFCIRQLQGAFSAHPDNNKVFSISNIVTKRRYDSMIAFREYCHLNNITFNSYLKISPVVWAQLLSQGVFPVDIHFRSISDAAFVNIMSDCTAAFDYSNHMQTGQTMRMIESICTGKKVITNNKWVESEPFYSPDRVHIFTGNDFSGVDRFLKIPLVKPDQRFENYYIGAFVDRLLGLR